MNRTKSRLPFSEGRLFVAKVRHMIGDKLPYIPFSGFLIAPAGSSEQQKRRTVATIATRNYGELIVLGKELPKKDTALPSRRPSS